ncbi:hypothetical protein [Microbacterium sp.]|uniref:hypothetical protein n=1 Tax=Microbacterium sp. TaxID=51671 RepID=UPI0039E26E3C
MTHADDPQLPGDDTDEEQRFVELLMRAYPELHDDEPDELTAADLETLARITATPVDPRARKGTRVSPRKAVRDWKRHERRRQAAVPRRSPAVAIPAVVAVVAIVVGLVAVGTFLAPERAAAVTPAPLMYTNDSRSVAQVLDDAASALAHAPAGQVPRRESVSTGWYYEVTENANGTTRTVIAPTTTTVTWAEDLSGNTRTVAAQPYWADLGNDALPADTPAPGTLLWEMAYGPGEFSTWYTAVPGDTEDDVLALLRAYGLTDPASAADVMTAIDGVLAAWTLTDAQEAQALRILEDAGGARVLGTASDRAGRPVVGVAAPLPGGTAEEHLLISADTGRIAGFETYTTASDGTFPANAIISYRLWDLP